MTNATTTKTIKTENNAAAEASLLSDMSDGLPHADLAGESLLKAARRLARRGIVSVESLSHGSFGVRLK